MPKAMVDRLVPGMNSFIFVHQLEVVPCPVHFTDLSQGRRPKQLRFFKTKRGRFGVENLGTTARVIYFALRRIEARFQLVRVALNSIRRPAPRKGQGRHTKPDGITRPQIALALARELTVAARTTPRFQ